MTLNLEFCSAERAQDCPSRLFSRGPFIIKEVHEVNAAVSLSQLNSPHCGMEIDLILTVALSSKIAKIAKTKTFKNLKNT